MQRSESETVQRPSLIVYLAGQSVRRTGVRPRRRRRVRSHRVAATPVASRDHLRGIIEASVGQVYGIMATDFASATRGRARVALARQIAMYLTHIACRQSLTDVGRIFARDRTTVAHACALIEDLRDDRTFDRVLDLLEGIICFRLTPHAGPVRGLQRDLSRDAGRDAAMGAQHD